MFTLLLHVYSIACILRRYYKPTAPGTLKSAGILATAIIFSPDSWCVRAPFEYTAAQELSKYLVFQPCSQVWSPELAKSILLRGYAEGEKALVALELLNFPPINGYSPEVREVTTEREQHSVCQFVLVGCCVCISPSLLPS